MEHPIKAYRAANALSLDALAEKAGTTKSTLSRIEARLLKPTSDLVVRLSDATGNMVTVEEIVRAAVQTSEAA